jgi:hypothetical protein
VRKALAGIEKGIDVLASRQAELNPVEAAAADGEEKALEEWPDADDEGPAYLREEDAGPDRPAMSAPAPLTYPLAGLLTEPAGTERRYEIHGATIALLDDLRPDGAAGWAGSASPAPTAASSSTRT